VTYLAVLGGGLNNKERLFVALAWLPKVSILDPKIRNNQGSRSGLIQSRSGSSIFPQSGSGFRIRIHKVIESGSNPDPDPQPW
jgi:hypothetical protein